LQVVVAEQEKSVGKIQAAIEAAKQQLADLSEKQKQENAEKDKLQTAISGTQVLIELGNQKFLHSLDVVYTNIPG
jgi:flagellar biosynthesis chaperone FliJ